MSTIEMIRRDAADFAHTYGLENEHTLAVCQLAEDNERWLREGEDNPMMYTMWEACLEMRKLRARLGY